MTPRARRALALVRALAVAAVLAGCAAAPGATGWTPAPIADIKNVAGKWEGELTRAHGPKDDWITLTIREDGTYEAVSYRVIGEFRGTGRFALDGGKLVSQGQRGTAIVGLATRGADRRLNLSLKSPEGVESVSTLAPAR